MDSRPFYKDQIRKFKDLKNRCPRPDRVEPIIQIYQEELAKSNHSYLLSDSITKSKGESQIEGEIE